MIPANMLVVGVCARSIESSSHLFPFSSSSSPLMFLFPYFSLPFLYDTKYVDAHYRVIEEARRPWLVTRERAPSISFHCFFFLFFRVFFVLHFNFFRRATHCHWMGPLIDTSCRFRRAAVQVWIPGVCVCASLSLFPLVYDGKKRSGNHFVFRC